MKKEHYSNIKDRFDEYHDSTRLLRRFVNTIILVSDQIEYADLIESMKDEKLFVIISDAFGLDLEIRRTEIV